MYGYFDPIGFNTLTDRERTAVEKHVKALVVNTGDKEDASQQQIIVSKSVQNAATNQTSVSKRSAVGAFLQAVGRETNNTGKKRTTLNEEIRNYRLLASQYVTMNDNEGATLRFWKMHAEKLPILATFARRFLATPGTSVPAESAFSTSNYIGRKERSRLTPENLSTIVFLKDKLAHK